MIYLLIAAVILALIYFATRAFLSIDQRVGGARVITCPETNTSARVEVKVGRAAFTSLLGQEQLDLSNCSRWPLKRDCGQECLLQVDVAPPECLVRSVLLKWYRGKRCVFCHRSFDTIGLTDHKPALLKGDGRTSEWSEIQLNEAELAMQTYQPVCWDCHIAQTFRREHPDLVVIRPQLDPGHARQHETTAQPHAFR